MVTLDLGDSVTDNRTVTSIIVENGSATLELTLTAFMITLLVGFRSGCWRALPGRPLGLRRPHLTGSSSTRFPVFFLGFLSQLWSPRARLADVGPGEPDRRVRARQDHPLLSHRHADGQGDSTRSGTSSQHLILPGRSCSASSISGVLIRLVRVNLLQTMQGDYVEAARARGVSERRVVVNHAFRNAMVPVVTVAGLQFAILLGGAVLTEETFNWPGIGSELVRYLNQRDYIAVQGIVTVFAVAVVIVSLHDRPRQRLHRSEGEVPMRNVRLAALAGADPRRDGRLAN